MLSSLMGKSWTKRKEIPLPSFPLASGGLALTLLLWGAAGAGDLLVPAIPAASTRENSLTESSNALYGLIISGGNWVWRRTRGRGLFCLENLFGPQVWFQFSLWNLDQTMLPTLIPFSQVADVAWTLQTACGTLVLIVLQQKHCFAFKVYVPSTQYVSTVY